MEYNTEYVSTYIKPKIEAAGKREYFSAEPLVVCNI